MVEAGQRGTEGEVPESQTADDGRSAIWGVRADGSVYVSFFRRKTAANGKPVPGAAYTSGAVRKPAGKPVKIFVSHRVPGVPRVRGKGKAQDL